METPLPSNPASVDEVSELAAPVIDQQKLEMYMHRLRMEQSLSKALIAGLLAATVSGMVWAAVTYITGYQIGFMAVGVGLLVGYAMRETGQGMDKIFGFAGALFALLGCIAGNYLCTVGYIADETGLGYFNSLASIDFSIIPELMMEVASPMDLLFYGIAMYEGYKFSFRQLTEQEILENASAPAVIQ